MEKGILAFVCMTVILLIHAIFGAMWISWAIEAFKEQHYFSCGLYCMFTIMEITRTVTHILKF